MFDSSANAARDAALFRSPTFRTPPAALQPRRRRRIRSALRKARQAVAGHTTTVAEDAVHGRLLEQIKSGDKSAFAQLYGLTATSLLSRARRILKSAADAEEVVSDVFVQVWRSSRRYCGERGSVMSWMHAICRNRALDRYRENQRRESMENASAMEAAAEQHAGRETPIRSNLETFAALRAVRTLSPLRQELFTGVYLLGFTQEQAARKLRIPIGTAKSHLRRTRQCLRQALGEDLGPAFTRR